MCTGGCEYQGAQLVLSKDATAVNYLKAEFAAKLVPSLSSAPLLIRTLGLKRPGVSSMVGVLLILAFTSHVSYLTFVSFDYGYNMAANASIGTVSSPLYPAGCSLS